ncbi:hypothetical protein ACHMW6_25710 [Pseudoduganella sp. UC29_106]|uniref:hypothetical protein n=1 Tax=Pseudoduganella sp. UC29_106 TaxID=3374553 RepID=UPI003756E5F3
MADTLRITLELDIADNPPLYQDLAKFPKGPRRVNRLRTLAYAGLIAQLVPQGPLTVRTIPPKPDQDSTMKAASLELFGPAFDL